MRAIVIFAACEGPTERIAARIADELLRSRVPTDTYNVTRLPADEIAIDAYNAVVLGSATNSGQYDPRIAWLIGAHRELLADIPSTFFSVSLGDGCQDSKAKDAAEWTAGEFLRELRYDPPISANFAGALHGSPSGWLQRQRSHWLPTRPGHQTVVNHGHDFTDWPAVDQFAQRFARFVHSCQQPGPTQPQRTSAWEPSHLYSTRRRDLSNR